MSLSSVKCLHKLASAYQAEQLQSYCGHLLPSSSPKDPSFRTPLELCAYALATRDPVLEEICVQFLAWNRGLTQAEAWLSVPPGLLQDLLSRTRTSGAQLTGLLRAVDEWSRRGAPPTRKWRLGGEGAVPHDATPGPLLAAV